VTSAGVAGEETVYTPKNRTASPTQRANESRALLEPLTGSRALEQFDPGRYRLRDRALGVIERANADADAAAIGELYGQAKESGLDAARYLLECGRALTDKRAELVHGHWRPWLLANADILGFEHDRTARREHDRTARREHDRIARTAQRLMQAWQKWCEDHNNNLEEANATLTSDLLTPDCAAKIINQVWGNARPTSWNQSESDEYYTPAKYVEPSREVLGGIDLDPASCEEAQRTVTARIYFTKEQNGLLQPWPGPGISVFLNSPYGDMAGQFNGKLIDEYNNGNVTAAITLVSAHSTDMDWFQRLLDHPVCFTDHRIAFSQKTDPIGGSAFFYLGDHHDLFYRKFIQFGRVRL
jgi:hypothetical protein